MALNRLILLLCLPALLSCGSTPPPVRAIRTPGIERIPLGVVLHPVFSTEYLKEEPRRVTASDGVSESFDREKMYLRPPAETTLKVTGASDRFTGLLSMELMARGFKLRDLPVQAPIEGESTFAVSLGLLDQLRERNNVRAILIGNAFFAPAGPTEDLRVTDFYLKMVDVSTLEVMYQITMPHDYRGWPMADVAREVANQFAIEAGLPISEE